jgi:cellulose 1,4-beta-cellobiosidase
MKYLAYLAAALAITPSMLSVAALPPVPPAQPPTPPSKDVNPYIGKSAFPIPGYAGKLEATIQYFKDQKDFLNAARTKTVQNIPTFTWISASKDVGSIATLAKEALKKQRLTRQKQLVQVVVYNLPDRDCSAKASDGEFHLDDDGLNKYYKFVDCKCFCCFFLV